MRVPCTRPAHTTMRQARAAGSGNETKQQAAGEVSDEISSDDIRSDVHLQHCRIGKVAYERRHDHHCNFYKKTIPMRHCNVLCRYYYDCEQ